MGRRTAAALQTTVICLTYSINNDIIKSWQTLRILWLRCGAIPEEFASRTFVGCAITTSGLHDNEARAIASTACLGKVTRV